MSELIHEVYPVEKGAFETAGEVSGTIKRMLRKLGVPSQVIRRVSVASDEVRTLGFGAGMGLPNMKRNADEFDIRSQVGVGTNIHMKFFCV